ncbi:hypothetical protein CBS101457_003738 [Exobasidium rhododendri]|nr:hypothetical protein CBS101457_003738 [Exobasidium rhododendri]
MACVVSSTVAACLDVFGVPKDKYVQATIQRASRNLGVVPDDTDIISLSKGACSWSSSGLQVESHSSIFANLHQHDFVCLEAQGTSMHHPTAVVVQDDVGEALLARGRAGNLLPEPGQVDVLVMGPPCQPFSSMNRQTREEREEDPRSLCVATGLSYVETYLPAYGIIENVCGILANGNLGIASKTGIVKFIFLCLAALGYRARMNILQCSAFGVPQHRKRVIILFAREGYELPQTPFSTYATSLGAGLYSATTLDSALSDLPKWDLRNPRQYHRSREGVVKPRVSLPVSFEHGPDGTVIGPELCRYATRPQNRFQERMRLTATDLVQQNHTFPPITESDLTIERIWNIPLDPGANHLSLQGIEFLELTEIISTADDRVFRNAFSRLDAKGQFPIIMTSMNLKGKTGRMLMPDQQRVPSIRELARAQGFPDSICFAGSPQEMMGQIGNAVPVPLATALGDSIFDAVVHDFLKGNTRFVKR